MRTRNADSPKSPPVKKTPPSAGIVVETLERSLRLKTQCANQFDSGALGCSDLQSLFSSLGFSEAAEPSVGKMGTGSCPLCAMDNLIDTDPGIGNGSSMRSLGP
nr:hypothetical protein [Tanacetum cinerariifolium]